MDRKTLEVIINQIQEQIDYCNSILDKNDLTYDERVNIISQIDRQREELERLNQLLSSVETISDDDEYLIDSNIEE